MGDSIALLGLLIGLELVLGVDNILVISIFVGKLPASQRNKARLLGLALAFLGRVIMLFVLLNLARLTESVLAQFSVRDLILMGGGLFLLYKAVVEIHHTIELKEERLSVEAKGLRTLSAVVAQIALLDAVFSIDSVVTAIGLTDRIWIIVGAVIVSFAAILFFAKQIGEFIIRLPSLKILALAFLITIGVTIFMEGMHQHVPKAYIYLPMGFALLVEILQLRYESNRNQKRKSGVKVAERK
jgi:predicted tellurium resistance membrane protein TerC